MATTITSPRSAVSMSAQISSGAAPATIGSSVNHSVAESPAIGSAAGQISKLYSAPLTVTAGTPLALDLTSLVDPLGNAVAIALLTDIYMTHDGVVAGQTLTIGGGTNPIFAASPHLIQPSGGEFKWKDRLVGITIDSTHKILTITAAAGTAVPFELSLWGR